ncbi:MAG: hypothetical protein AAFV95_01900 [Bacteroidota bacterium]
MKKIKFPIYPLFLLFVAGMLLFNSCNKEETIQPATVDLEIIELSPDGSEIVEAIILDSEEEFTDDLDAPQEDLAINEERIWCVYKIDRIIRSNDRFRTLRGGDRLCYRCPDSGECPKADCVERVIRVTRIYNGRKYVSYTTVKVSGGGTSCISCPAGGKRIRSVVGPLPGGN